MIKRQLSVTEVNRFVKTLIATNSVLKSLEIKGEVSNFKRQASGHLYFSLKDVGARIGCVMFRSDAAHLDFEPEDGMHVVCKGRDETGDRYGHGGALSPLSARKPQNGLRQLHDAVQVLAGLGRQPHHEVELHAVPATGEDLVETCEDGLLREALVDDVPLAALTIASDASTVPTNPLVSIMPSACFSLIAIISFLL